MNVLFVSEYGQSAGLASRLQKEGNNVKMALTKGGRVFFDSEQVAYDFAAEIGIDGGFDVVVVDSAANGRLAERVRKAGRRVLGGSTWSEAISQDNAYLQSVLTSVGIPTSLPQSPSNINLYISGWFDGVHFTNKYVSLVYRRMMVGGKGKDLGCTGTLSYHRNRSGKPYANVLKPLESVLRKVNHCGPVHAHAVVSSDAYAVTELITDIKHPLSFALTERSRVPLSQTLLGPAGKEDTPAKVAWSSSALLAYPPYPYHNDLEVEGTPSLPGVSAVVLKHTMPIGMREISGDYHICGGEVCYALGGGDVFTDAVRRMYRTLSTLEIPNCMYRTDIGRGVQGMLYSLEKWGWII